MKISNKGIIPYSIPLLYNITTYKNQGHRKVILNLIEESLKNYSIFTRNEKHLTAVAGSFISTIYLVGTGYYSGELLCTLPRKCGKKLPLIPMTLIC